MQSSRPTLMGVETEYGLAAFEASGEPRPADDVAQELLEQARATLTHLPSADGAGVFLANGGRFYVDCGHHPEFCTPECTDPFEAAGYVLAGDHLIARLAHRVELRDPGLEVVPLKGNTDPAARTTWAAHEDYLHVGPRARLAADLVPHLASRLIFSGAGGLTCAPGIRFSISPRVHFLIHVHRNDSVAGRAILNVKAESLSSTGRRRVHLMCGESLCSETALVLKLGTTALVARMSELGLRPGATVTLAKPLEAMRSFADDCTLAATASTKAGARVTALDLQRHYLSVTEAHMSQPGMPDWAPALCTLWKNTLERFTDGPGSIATCLDWAIRLALFQDRARRSGFSWEAVGVFSDVLANARGSDEQDVPWEAPDHIAISPTTPPEGAADRLARVGHAWGDLERFHALRSELLEIDALFGALGDRGLFGQLGARGTLEHAVPGVRRSEEAFQRPPAHSRARLRGAHVLRLGGSPRATADWTHVDDGRGRALDLSDPFEHEERWGERPPPPSRSSLRWLDP